jgi:hypothetical protein
MLHAADGALCGQQQAQSLFVTADTAAIYIP